MTTMKLAWRGEILSVQPRIRLLRSFDQRQHAYQGYTLRVRGSVDARDTEFLLGLGKAAQEKHGFRRGDEAEGMCCPVSDPPAESVEFYKVSGVKLLQRGPKSWPPPPPWQGEPPELAAYRERGHRRLDARTYATQCSECIWGARMAVEMTIDHWNPSQKKYRYETFCYGPKSCAFYRPGRRRVVPGRKGMSWEEPDWVDEEETSHREEDE